MLPESPSWPLGPTALQLAPGEVHVWRASLDPPPERRELLAARLSAAERARRARFHFERDASRYETGRGILRELLGRYLGERPEALRLAESEHGRPYLREIPGLRQIPGRPRPAGPRSVASPDFDFNLSHSRDLAVYAFCRGARVGVDVEWVTPLDDMDDLVAINFSRSERETFAALPSAAREPAFFACWTRKEAFVKAIGEGLSHPLDAFDVSLAPGEAPALLRLGRAPNEAVRWSLCALEPAPGCAGALAVEQAPLEVQRFSLAP